MTEKETDRRTALKQFFDIKWALSRGKIPQDEKKYWEGYVNGLEFALFPNEYKGKIKWVKPK